MDAASWGSTRMIPEGYELVRPLGTGRLGQVLLCRDLKSGRERAVKILDLQLADERSRLALHGELLAAAVAAQHPCAVTVTDVWFCADGRAYVAMDACLGGSAQSRLDSAGPLPVDEVVVLGIRLSQALDAAHRRGVLHLDVRPANVLESPSGEWLLADHGVARAVARAAPGQGAIVDPSYAPREMLGWEQPGPGTDVYGLGATMYALLAGRPAYAQAAERGPAEHYAQLLAGELPPPRAALPDPLFDLLRRMMAVNAEGRPPLHEVDRALRALLPPTLASRVPEPRAETPAEEPEPAAVPPTRRGWPVLVLAATVGALAVVLGGVLLLGDGDPPRTPNPTTTITSTPQPVPPQLRPAYLVRQLRVIRSGSDVLVTWQPPRTTADVSGFVVTAESSQGDQPPPQIAEANESNVVFTIPPADSRSCFVVTTFLSRGGGVEYARGEPKCLDGP
jgi:serine/threonine protein kinase